MSASGQLRVCTIFRSSTNSSPCTSSIRASRYFTLVTIILSFGWLLSHDLRDTIRSLSKPIVSTISETFVLGWYFGLIGSGIDSRVVPTIFLTAHLTRCHTLENDLVSEVTSNHQGHLPDPNHEAVRENHIVRRYEYTSSDNERALFMKSEKTRAMTTTDRIRSTKEHLMLPRAQGTESCDR